MALMKVVAAAAGQENIVDLDIPLVLADNTTTVTDITIASGTLSITVDTAFASAAALTAAANASLINLVEQSINDPYHIPVLEEIEVPSTWERKNMHAQTVYKIISYTI